MDAFRQSVPIVQGTYNSLDEVMNLVKGKTMSQGFPLKLCVKRRTSCMTLTCSKSNHAKSKLGLSRDLVKNVAATLHAGQTYKEFADNFFTSLPQLVKLLEHEIQFVATVLPVTVPNLW